MPSGNTFKLYTKDGEGVEIEVCDGVLYEDSFVFFDTGLTVASFVSDSLEYTVKFIIPTMQYNEFESQSIAYEVLVVPSVYKDTAVTDADGFEYVSRFTETLTLTDTESFYTNYSSVIYVNAGESITLSFRLEDETIPVSLEIYQILDTGFEMTETCFALFDGISGSVEQLEFVDSSVTFNVLESAADGRYYLRFSYNNKFVYVTIRVIAN